MVNKKIATLRYVAGQAVETFEALAGEEALQIKINGSPYTITMRTPGQDKALAGGLLLTERVISRREDVIRIAEVPAEGRAHNLVVDVGVKEEVLTGKNLFNRSIASSASCGVCGKTELCDLVTPQQSLVPSRKLDIHLIPSLAAQMLEKQSTFESTGGSHAAAAFNMEGNLLSVQEDIGRHNAVDKVIGDLLFQDLLPQADVLFISGRVSYEIAAKCAVASIPFLLAVSAPSSLAVDFCERYGITLIGFCRENRATVYTHQNNIMQHSSSRLRTVNEVAR